MRIHVNENFNGYFNNNLSKMHMMKRMILKRISIADYQRHLLIKTSCLWKNAP